MNNIHQDTIAAIATAKGIGGIGVVRVSGPLVREIMSLVVNRELKPRQALACDFLGKCEIIDSGLAIFFPTPNSFTGEDVLELQGHGGPIVLDCVLERVLSLGARIARPGEFSERAFLNNKMDLAESEAVIDLIHAQSKAAAMAATKTLKGVFSEKITHLETKIINLRMFVEAFIDFPDEELDIDDKLQIENKLKEIKNITDTILQQTKVGTRLNEGINAVILGEPNVGKSSLLNALSGENRAIVTDIPGTTRDILHNSILINGVHLNLLDTAGIRESVDVVEKEGIKRAKIAALSAELILFMLNCEDGDCDNSPFTILPELKGMIESGAKLIVIINKIDKINLMPKVAKIEDNLVKVFLSVKNNLGLNLLQDIIKETFDLDSGNIEGAFLARRRHIEAIQEAKNFVELASTEFSENKAYELLAENLRQAHLALSNITGKFSADDLLGKIFSEFCIGK